MFNYFTFMNYNGRLTTRNQTVDIFMCFYFYKVLKISIYLFGAFIFN